MIYTFRCVCESVYIGSSGGEEGKTRTERLASPSHELESQTA